MDTALGLLGFLLFIVAVIGLAAGMSWLVVKLTPAPKTQAKRPAEPSS